MAAFLAACAEWSGGAPVVITARKLNYCWERFIQVKEAMHLFDCEHQKVGTSELFSSLLNEFVVPTPDRSEGMNSEVRGLWMALGLFCPEEWRRAYAERRAVGEITDLEIATELRIPEFHVPRLFVPDYLERQEGLIDLYKAAA